MSQESQEIVVEMDLRDVLSIPNLIGVNQNVLRGVADGFFDPGMYGLDCDPLPKILHKSLQVGWLEPISCAIYCCPGADVNINICIFSDRIAGWISGRKCRSTSSSREDAPCCPASWSDSKSS